MQFDDRLKTVIRQALDSSDVHAGSLVSARVRLEETLVRLGLEMEPLARGTEQALREVLADELTHFVFRFHLLLIEVQAERTMAQAIDRQEHEIVQADFARRVVDLSRRHGIM